MHDESACATLSVSSMYILSASKCAEGLDLTLRRIFAILSKHREPQSHLGVSLHAAEMNVADDLSATVRHTFNI